MNAKGYATIAACFGALLVACFPSLEGLTNGGAKPSDASSPDSDGGTARADGSTSDGPSGPWCASNTPANGFCCDFDPDDLTVCGVSGNTYGDGVFSLDRAVFSSPQGSLLTTVPSSSAGNGAFARALLEYKSKLASNTHVADLAFSMRIDKVGSVHSAGIANVNFANGSKAFEARLNLDTSGRIYVSQFDPKTSDYSEPFHAPLPLTVGAWIRVHYHVELQGVGQGTADLDIDGKRIATAVPLTPTLPDGTLQTLVGLTFVSSPTNGWGLHVDDLTIVPK